MTHQDTLAAVERRLDAPMALAALRCAYPWLGTWQIAISPGLVKILADFCEAIEPILGPQPTVEFLHVFDEINPENEFQAHLMLFIEPNNQKAAQGQAIEHFVVRAVNLAKQTCRHCGSRLQYVTFGEKPFLPKPPDAKGLRGDTVCVYCAEQCWNQRQAAQPWAEGAQGQVPAETPAEHAATFEPSRPFDHFVDNEALDDAAASIFDFSMSDEADNAEEGSDSADDNTHANAGIISNANAIDNAGVNTDAAKTTRIAVPTLRLFDPADLEALEAEIPLVTKERGKQIKAWTSKLKALGPDRRLACQPENWRDGCQNLLGLFPNFSAVIAFIQQQMALAAQLDGVFVLPPVLLIGPPGIGKTEFLLALVKRINSQLEIIDMSAAQSGSTLAGSEAFWSNTQPGGLFTALVLGPVANPIILLDEVDKARKDNVYNPLGALHQLLEPRQAQRFKDLSLPTLTLNASHVIWVATGNEIEAIDKPILDRFVVFEIEKPSAIQMRVIAQSVYQRVLERYQQTERFEVQLSVDILDALTPFNPRQVRKILESALGRAAYDERVRLLVEDIVEVSRPMRQIHKSPIGFM